jgi:hypothetical protein
MDATHSLDRGLNPFALFVARLSQGFGGQAQSPPDDSHKRRKSRWARTTLQMASIDAANAINGASRGEGSEPLRLQLLARTAAPSASLRLEPFA